MVSFGTIIVLLAASLVVLALLERRQARTDLARALLERALARTNGDLSELLAPVKRQLAIDWHEVRMGSVPRYDAAAHLKHFLPALRELPMVGSMTIADTAGHQMLLMRYDSTLIASPLLEGRTDLVAPASDDPRFITRDFRPALRGDRSLWQLWSPDATEAEKTFTVLLPGYDPRELPWYLQALERFARHAPALAPHAAPAIAWSDVYTFFTSREPGVTASFAARDPSGALVVVVYGVLLDELSRYTRSAAPTPNGRILVVSDSGWLVGHPRDARLEDRATRLALTMVPVERLGDPVMDAWATAWRSRGVVSTRIEQVTVDGERWWSAFRPFEIAPGRRFWIGAMVPEADVLATMGAEGVGIVLASLVALLVAFAIAARLARRVADPLAELAALSARIARLDVVATAPPVTRLREVRQLGAAIEEMRQALEANFAEREASTRALAESEARLLQSQKLEAVGQLAGGVAHDFNNLLTAIRGYASLLRERLEGDVEGTDDLNEIDAAAQRAADLTGQLLSFSRRQHVEPKVVDVNELVSSASKLLTRLMSERVTLETVLEPDLPAVRIDPNQLHQVLVNLAVNARDAMADGGTLTITTSRGGRIRALEGEDHEFTAVPGLPPVVISVVDTGIGMPPEVRERVFEPFFTTKEIGRGTGLGLATCWGIVRDAGGLLEIDSVPGEGTVVRVILPPEAASPISAALDDSQAPTGPGGETVLLVEDDEQIRALTERALRRAGFTVLVASDGVAALDLLRQRGRPPDLLVTDVVMPRLGGPGLARKVQERWPMTRVLFITGYAEADAFGSEGIPATAAEVLRKPFTPSELVRAVRTMMDTPREH